MKPAAMQLVFQELIHGKDCPAGAAAVDKDIIADSAINALFISKRFDGKPPALAVDALDLTISPGEFLVLLGPSGCGKTTTLRCLAGLETPDSGRIVLGDAVVFDSEKRIDVPPDRRDIGMVFQSYALWPHMTVRQNIAYPLRARRLRHGLRDGWVESTAELVDCTSLLDRYPSQLSGGQQQRVGVAVARRQGRRRDDGDAGAVPGGLPDVVEDARRGVVGDLDRQRQAAAGRARRRPHQGAALPVRHPGALPIRAGQEEAGDAQPDLVLHHAADGFLVHLQGVRKGGGGR